MQKVLFVIGVSVLGTFIYWEATKSQPMIDELLLKNVEALADMEDSGSNLPMFCLMSGDCKCPDTDKRVRFVVEGYSLGDDAETY